MNSLKSADLSRATPTSLTHRILIDSHVHIYDCFDIDTFLASAWQNFSTQASQVGAQATFTAVLLLTESKQHNWFQTLSDTVGETLSPASPWTVLATAEPYSLKAVDHQGRTIYLIAGRQIVTAEKLEVLALICDRTFPDGRSTEATIADIQAAGGIAVLPWGMGKWVGERGQLVTRLLHQKHLSPLFLGDNSGRPGFWAKPSYFAQAEQPILLGTDPLPLKAEAHRPGKFGLMLVGILNENEPGKSLRTQLLNPAVHWQPYGHLENPWQFVRNQTAIRLNSPPALSPPMNNSPTLSDFPETADIETSSEDYATRFTGAIGQWLLQVQETATLNMLAAYPQAKVLDVGGGHGQLTQALIEAGYDVTVLGSAEACKTRIQTYIDQGQCAFQVGNVLDMPYPDHAFDVVISYRFLAHVAQWEKFLAELTRVAKQAVLVDYPTVRSINYITPLLFKLKKGLEGNTRPYTCYRETEITKHFQSLNFMQTDRYAQFALPMVIHRALKQPKISSFLEHCIRLTGMTRWLGSPVILKVSRP